MTYTYVLALIVGLIITFDNLFIAVLFYWLGIFLHSKYTEFQQFLKIFYYLERKVVVMKGVGYKLGGKIFIQNII